MTRSTCRSRAWPASGCCGVSSRATRGRRPTRPSTRPSGSTSIACSRRGAAPVTRPPGPRRQVEVAGEHLLDAAGAPSVDRGGSGSDPRRVQAAWRELRPAACAERLLDVPVAERLVAEHRDDGGEHQHDEADRDARAGGGEDDRERDHPRRPGEQREMERVEVPRERRVDPVQRRRRRRRPGPPSRGRSPSRRGSSRARGSRRRRAGRRRSPRATPKRTMWP